MVERKYELPTTSNVIMGIGLGLGSDGGGIRPMDTITEGTAAESDTERLLSRWEEVRRNMTPDGSLSRERKEEWTNAARDLEYKHPDLFND